MNSSKKQFIVLLFLIFLTNIRLLNAQNTHKLEIKAYVEKIITQQEIPGVALAIIQNGAVIHEGYYGNANLEHQVPVQSQTIFRVYSLTKPMVATAIFQLIEKGLISKSDKVSKYLPNLPGSWQSVRIDHLLTHSSGLPEMVGENNATGAQLIEQTAQTPLKFDPGHRFRYTQTNFYLLEQILEKVTGTSFEEYMHAQHFASAPKGVLFSSNTLEIIPNRANRYSMHRERNTFEMTTYVNSEDAHSGNGLNITLQEFIKWNERLDNGKLLKAGTKNAMWSEFDFITPDRFAFGWGIYPIANQLSYGFTGGGCTGYRKFINHDLSIIWLTNGAKNNYDMNRVINRLAGMVNSDLEDQALLVEDQLLDVFREKSVSAAISQYRQIKKANKQVNFEGILNSIGYGFASQNRLDDAIAIFKLNVEEYPGAWNVYDSLAEGYEMSGDTAKAIKFYKKSVELNPDNEHGREKLKLLGQ